MAPRARVVKSAVVLLVGMAALVVPGTASVSAGATPPTSLYVDPIRCPDPAESADGTVERPFCTISAAAAVVQPGQTVYVEATAGGYGEPLNITRSGTSTAPITFVAVNNHEGMVRLTGAGATVTTVVVSGQHDVILRNFVIYGLLVPAVQITDSSAVTLEGGSIHQDRGAAITVTGASSGVTIKRTVVTAPKPLQVGAGVTGTVISTNQFYAPYALSGPAYGPAVQVTDAPGTVITSNTVISTCSDGIVVGGASTNTSIFNNIVETSMGSEGKSPKACASTATAVGISIAAQSLPATADYNLLDPTSGAPLYSWGGADYADPAAFATATGQGAHDLAANPQIQGYSGVPNGYFMIGSTSSARDSADANAVGELPTDLLLNPRTDDPSVANTGTGFGYADRGALEPTGQGVIPQPTLSYAPGGGVFDAVLTAQATLRAPSTGGPWGTVDIEYSGARYPIVTRDTTTTLSFPKPGRNCATVYINFDDFRTTYQDYSASPCITLGTVYTPVSPRRILDTRSAIGVSTKTPVAPGADVVLPLGSIGGVSAAVVMNVTVTKPSLGGYLTVYPDGQGLPVASNLNFNANQTVANLVTVQVTDGSLRFHNGSAGTVHVVADLAGYYSGSGSGFAPMMPKRVLDTRNGTGTRGAGPLVGPGTLQLDLSSAIPSGATAVAMNVTVTKPKLGGYLTVYPDGESRPVASNLNFNANQTLANLVVVPVHNGKVDIFNPTTGPVHVIADVSGYFGGTGATQRFVPESPHRLLDTRKAPYVALEPLSGQSVYVGDSSGSDGPNVLGAVVNVTATRPTLGGYLTVYPGNSAVPVASTLNFDKGQTVPNLAMAAAGYGYINLYNGSAGYTDAIVDEEGYFFDPAVG